MSRGAITLVALSGGVDSAVAALLLRDAGHDVQCLHMTNWEGDEGYCETAQDFQDARRVCLELGVPLHRVNFAREYHAQVFAKFLAEHRAGRTPNPDVLCNREIKFGLMRGYAKRLGAQLVATGHYARLSRTDGKPQLLKGADPAKDQSYFLHAVQQSDLADAVFPLGELRKSAVRQIARDARLATAEKKDSTGICFIGERPFGEFLSRYLPEDPGRMLDDNGLERGTHRGLAYYTLGQRHGLNIGGTFGCKEEPWYVAAKDTERNELVVVQGHDHPRLFQNWLSATDVHWIGIAPAVWADGAVLRCAAKVRYRQPDQACSVIRTGASELEVWFDEPQRAPTPGQYVVFYDGDRCLGGATIERCEHRAAAATRAVV